ncbi:alpha/beta fold hydrolase [Micromonospora sp. NPDC050417]|uniref:alpha/beta fold hydrolase n=1 Tax=Micromonospora sp. NPDC050417 TaxID=3364280 RepID=UPI00379876B8
MQETPYARLPVSEEPGQSSVAVRHPIWRWGAAVLVAVAWGVASAFWTPRGPLTTAQALWSIGFSLAVGVGVGWTTRSRWSMPLAPVAFVVALELARWPITGPSVDGIHLSPFGVLVLISGRGVHGLLSVLPMVFGAAYGAGIARRAASTRTGSRALRYLGRAGTGLLAAVVLLVTVAVAVPARTAPILGPDGEPLTNSVAELGSIDVGPHRLGVMIRGNDTSAPVLLYVPGAPGGSDIGPVRRHLEELERQFVVVTLDRRGGGKSASSLDPTSALTLESAVVDVIAVTNHLRDRFGQEKIYLLGHSGGSLLTTLAVQRRPELFRAYIGTGQAVNLPTSDRIFHEDHLTWARERADGELERRLVDLGPPPYPGFYPYEPFVTHTNEVYAYDRSRNAEGDGGPTESLNVPEYTLLEKLHTLTGLVDTWSVLYPLMQDVDLRTDVRQLQVPVYFVQGGHETRALAEPFAQWYELLQAPSKRLVVLETSGHRPMFEQPDRFVDVMATVLTDTRP